MSEVHRSFVKYFKVKTIKITFYITIENKYNFMSGY